VEYFLKKGKRGKGHLEKLEGMLERITYYNPDTCYLVGRVKSARPGIWSRWWARCPALWWGKIWI
jgi:hypothetical protein